MSHQPPALELDDHLGVNNKIGVLKIKKKGNDITPEKHNWMIINHPTDADRIIIVNEDEYVVRATALNSATKNALNISRTTPVP